MISPLINASSPLSQLNEHSWERKFHVNCIISVFPWFSQHVSFSPSAVFSWYQSILLLFYKGRESDSNTFELCLYNLKYEKSVEDEFLFAIYDYAEHNSIGQAWAWQLSVVEISSLASSSRPWNQWILISHKVTWSFLISNMYLEIKSKI